MVRDSGHDSMNTDRVAPVGWHTVTPRLVARNAKGLVEFIHSVFEAEGSFDAYAAHSLVGGGTTVCQCNRRP